MNKKYIGKTCPYCKTPLVEGDTVVFCSVCDMPHHLSCWQDNQGCTTFGCTGSIKEIAGSDAGTVTASAELRTAPTPTRGASATLIFTPSQAEQPEKPVEILHESKKMFFMPDVPLVLENTAIIIDRTKDKLFARCDFRCTTDKAIKAVLIEISCQDVWGNTLGNPIAYQYLDLKTKRESKFGQTNPIELADKTTRDIRVLVKKVLLADGSIITGGDKSFEMATPVLLSQHLKSEDLAAEYARETTSRAQFVPETMSPYWRCACGALNVENEDICHSCGCSKENLLAALDPEQLNANMLAFRAEKRAAEEKARAEQAERIRIAEEQVRLERARKEQEILAAEQAKEEKKRRNKKIIISICAAVLAALLVCAIIIWGIPFLRYQSACSALKRGDYDIAYQAFVELDDFMDSTTMAKEALYQKGDAALENKQFDEAIGIFADLGKYSDSEDRLAEAKRYKENAVKEARYQEGIAAINGERYDDAIAIFTELGNYAESKSKLAEAQAKKEELVKKARYEEGVTALNNRQYDTAIKIFTELGEFSDSKEKLAEAQKKRKEARYQEGVTALNNKQYSKAVTIFSELGNYSDSKAKLAEAQEKYNEVCYQDGLTALSSGNYDKAAQIFAKLGGYSDSKDKLVEAKYGQACNYYNNRNYQKAVSIFGEITHYQDSATKLTESMYGYVLAHKDRKDTTTFEYLKKLKNQNYKDSAAIYADLYKWKVTLTAFNTKYSDYSTIQTSISRYCSYLHFEFKVSGGAPGESVNLTHTTYWPDGDENVSDWHWDDEQDGGTCGAEWRTGLSSGKTGKLTIKVYNLNTGELLGTFGTTLY